MGPKATVNSSVGTEGAVGGYPFAASRKDVVNVIVTA